MRWVVIAVAALLVGLLTYGVTTTGVDTTIESALAEGRNPRAPDRSLPMLGADAPARLADFRGKVVLVNFWASWCDPCEAEAPDLVRLQERMERSGATIVGINARDASGAAQTWVEKHGITYPSLRDGSGDYSDEWGVPRYPESFLLDEQGRIQALIRGPITDDWIDAHVTPLLES